MANIKKKIRLLGEVIIGSLVKVRVKYDLYVRHSIRVSGKVEPTMMVTLTSYGHRLQHSVEYTLHSLLCQVLRPGRIVVWVYEGEFTDGQLPACRKVFERYGVEFLPYPRDIRSYKKLIPALEHYPHFHHVIVDDDIYYTSTLLSELWAFHQDNPHSIIAHAVDLPKFSDDGKTLVPYKQWKQYTTVEHDFRYDPMFAMPIGFGGVFYPEGVFDEEVADAGKFLEMCPLADDIWFYVHSIRLGIKKVKVIGSKVKCLPVDLLRQYVSRDRLTAVNRLQNENDRQLSNLLSYYSLSIVRSEIDCH